LETKYNAKAMSNYRHHSTYKSGIWQHKGESIHTLLDTVSVRHRLTTFLGDFGVRTRSQNFQPFDQGWHHKFETWGRLLQNNVQVKRAEKILYAPISWAAGVKQFYLTFFSPIWYSVIFPHYPGVVSLCRGWVEAEKAIPSHTPSLPPHKKIGAIVKLSENFARKFLFKMQNLGEKLKLWAVTISTVRNLSVGILSKICIACRKIATYCTTYFSHATAIAHLSHCNSVCLSVRPSVRPPHGSVKNGATYRSPDFHEDSREDSSFRISKTFP